MQKFQNEDKTANISPVPPPRITDELNHRDNVASAVFMQPQHGDVETLAALIQGHTPKRHGMAIRCWQFITLLDSLFVILIGLRLMQDGSESSYLSDAVINDMVHMFTPLLILIMATSLFGWETRYRLARAALATADTDFRWLNALFELLSWPDNSLRTVARLRLLRLIPGLEADNCPHLTLEAMQSMKRQLDHVKAISDPELAAVILDAGSRLNLGELQPEARILSHSPLVRGSVRKGARNFLLQQANIMKRPAGDSELHSSNSAVTEDYSYASFKVPRMRKPFFYLYSVIALFYGGTELLVKLYHVLGYGIGEITPRVVTGIFGWTALILSPLILKRLLLKTAQITQIRRIARSEDVCVIPYLLAALTLPDRYINILIRNRLKVLLPNVLEQNRHLFQRVHHEKLQFLLRPREVRKDPDLAKSILSALIKIGDTTDLPSVKRLAQMRPLNSKQNIVVEAAAHTLEILSENFKIHGETDSLLRSTSPQEKAHLLRSIKVDSAEMLLKSEPED